MSRKSNSKKVQWAAFCFWWIRWAALMSNSNSVSMRNTVLMHWANVSPNCIHAYSFLVLFWGPTCQKLIWFLFKIVSEVTSQFWILQVPRPLWLLTSSGHLTCELLCIVLEPNPPKFDPKCYCYRPHMIVHILMAFEVCFSFLLFLDQNC